MKDDTTPAISDWSNDQLLRALANNQLLLRRLAARRASVLAELTARRYGIRPGPATRPHDQQVHRDTDRPKH